MPQAPQGLGVRRQAERDAAFERPSTWENSIWRQTSNSVPKRRHGRRIPGRKRKRMRFMALMRVQF
jgi:hypothetical protein